MAICTMPSSLGHTKGHVWTILGPCLHMFSFQLGEIMSQRGIKDISQVFKFGTLLRPYLDHVMAMFAQLYFQTSYSSEIFKTESAFCKGHVDEVYFLDYAGTMFLLY